MYKLTEDGIKYFQDYFGIEFQPLPQVKHKKNPLKVLTVSDIHAPFHHGEYLNKVFDNTDCKDVKIMGDLWDFYSRSRWRASKDVDFRREFREGYYILQRFAQNFDTVYLMLANHDLRIIKYMYNNAPKECLPFIHSGILQELIGFIPNVKIVNQQVNHNRIAPYVWQKDNVIYTHIEKSSTDVGKTVTEISKIMSKWYGAYNLKPYNIIMQAHNHCSAKLRIGDTFLFQLPCLIDISETAFDYVFDGTVKGNPPALGYIVEYLNEDGTVDPVRTNIVDFV